MKSSIELLVFATFLMVLDHVTALTLLTKIVVIMSIIGIGIDMMNELFGWWNRRLDKALATLKEQQQ